MKNKAKKSTHQKNKVSKILRGVVTKRESLNKKRRLSRASKDAEEERERESVDEESEEEQDVQKAAQEFDESAEWELEVILFKEISNLKLIYLFSNSAGWACPGESEKFATMTE